MKYINKDELKSEKRLRDIRICEELDIEEREPILDDNDKEQKNFCDLILKQTF